MVEVVLPDIQRLKTVDHRTIISVGSGGQDDKHQTDVSPPESRILDPGDLGKFPVSETEGASGWGLHL